MVRHSWKGKAISVSIFKCLSGCTNNYDLVDLSNILIGDSKFHTIKKVSLEWLQSNYALVPLAKIMVFKVATGSTSLNLFNVDSKRFKRFTSCCVPDVCYFPQTHARALGYMIDNSYHRKTHLMFTSWPLLHFEIINNHRRELMCHTTSHIVLLLLGIFLENEAIEIIPLNLGIWTVRIQ